MGDKKITHLCRWLILLKFTRFMGGPNGPKICGGRTNTDFKDRDCEVCPLPVTFPLMRRSQGGVAGGEIIFKDIQFKGTTCQPDKFRSQCLQFR